MKSGHCVKACKQKRLSLERLEVRSMLAADLVISEFLASSSGGLADEDGDFPDWIELHNRGASDAHLAGWYLTDNASNLAKWQLPAVTLQPDEYLVVFASGKDRTVVGGELHANFSLSAAGEYLGLVMPDGQTVVHAYSPAFPPQGRDVSYGLGEIVAQYDYVGPGSTVQTVVPVNSSYDAVWQLPEYVPDGNWFTGTVGVGFGDFVNGFTVRNYKAAPGVQVSSIVVAEDVVSDPSLYTSVVSGNFGTINFSNGGGTGRYPNPAPFPGQQINVNVDDFVVVVDAVVTIPAAGNWTFGVRSDDGFRLTVGDQVSGFPGPRGPADTLQTFTFDTAGDYNLNLLFFERGGGAMLELFAAPGTYSSWNSTNFRLVGNTAGGGLAVKSNVTDASGGHINQLVGTNIRSQMLNVSSTFYARIPFQVDDPGNLDQLLLRMQYDDAFVAAINGVEVARRNATGTTAWNSTASSQRTIDQALAMEDIDISSFLPLLNSGENVLAIQGINFSVSDPDVLVMPRLVGIEQLGFGEAYFATPTPGGPNANGYIGFMEKAEMSVEHGFFFDAFEVEISVGHPAAKIYYTTDGRMPSPITGTLYAGPIEVSGTTVLRASAFLGGYLPANAATQTYLFPLDILQQSAAGPEGWPTGTVNSQILTYGMHPSIVNSPVWGPQLIDAFLAIPTYSIVTDVDYLFDASSGIYVNAQQRGRDWEREASLELIHPDGTPGFQIDSGVRIRGGFSRSGSNPKHAFRFYFRNDYEGPLQYSVFGAEGADEFSRLDLRTSQNYSWSFLGDSRMTMLRDILARDIMRDLGQPYSRGHFAFLYINGEFWGIFQTEERKEANFGATYFGGDADDYDVIKTEVGPYTIVATDGNLDAFQQLWALSNQVAAAATQPQKHAIFMQMQGLNPDGSRNLGFPVLLDADNLIDYMLTVLYTGSFDGPISQFIGSNSGVNNWYGIRNRNGDMGFQFLVHDTEHSFINLNENRNGPYPAGTTEDRANPQWIHQQLMHSDEYRMQFADRVQAVMFNGGPLTTQANLARHNARAAEITLAIIAESARWGASKVSTPFNRNHWLTAVNSVNNQIAQRTAIVINQFRNTRIIHPTTGPLAPLFPSIDAPLMSQFGGEIDPSDQLSLSKPSGSPGSAVIYYTLDGSDPRLVGGGLSPTAILYNGPFSLNLGTQVKARILNGSAWSAAVTATFDVLHAADFSFDFVDQTYQQNFNSFVGTESTVPPHFTVQAGGASVFRTVFDARTDSAGDFTGIMAATSDGQNYSLAWRESTGPANLDDARILFTFTNNTGVPLTGFDVSYDVEAWVNGRRDNQIRFKFDVYPDSSSAQAAEGRNAFETDIFATPNPNHTPIASNNAQFVLDGKDLANRTTVSGHVDLRTLLVDESDPAKGVFGELLPGQTAYFRWQISNGNLTDGNRSALGIDNISITARVESSVESADFNGDGFVDGLDFLTWQRGLGTVNASPADGDANGDGQVNGADLVIWQNQFGQPAPTTAMASRTSSDESPQFSAMTAEESAMPRSALHIPPSLVSAEASTAAEPLSIVWLAMQEEDSDASEQLAETSQLPNVYDVDSAFAQAGPAITSSLEDDDWFEGYVADESAEIADDLIAELAWTAFDSMLEG